MQLVLKGVGEEVEEELLWGMVEVREKKECMLSSYG